MLHQIRVVPREGQELPTELRLLPQIGAKSRNGEVTFPAFRQRDILANLCESDRTLFLSKCIRKKLSKGELLFVAGDPHTATFLIDSGLIRTFHESSSGKEITLGYWSAKDIIGGPYFFDDTGVHVWSARAVQDSKVLLITGRDLRTLVTSIPTIGEAVLDAITFKLLWDSLLLQVLGTRSSAARLAHLLVKLTAVFGVAHGLEITVSHYFTQEDFANMIGATRQWVNIQLRHFQRNGVLEIRNRQIIIRDFERLKKLCEW
jgi:CRP/FNR family transcriptional regulator